MSPVIAIALVSLGLSALTFVATQITGRRSATASYVLRLEGRVKDLENKVAGLETRNGELVDENIRLMKQLTRERKEGP